MDQAAMRIAYVTNARIPTEKAHGYQIMRVCLELARAGHHITLVVPEVPNSIKMDAFSYYGLANEFKITYIPTYYWLRHQHILGNRAFIALTRAFLSSAVKRHPLSPGTHVISRNPEAAEALGPLGLSVFYNAHDWPQDSARTLRLLRQAKGIICNSEGTSTAVRNDCALPTLIAPNATDENPFCGRSRVDLRRELGLPVDVGLAIYTGHLYEWKGSRSMIEAAELLEGANVQIIAVGGLEKDIESCKTIAQERRLSNIHFVGHRSRNDAAKYQAAADLLLLPNTSHDRESTNFTSPLKMFEYMSSGNPIIASALPSIRTILDETCAFLIPPDDPVSLAAAIRRALESRAASADRAQVALSRAKDHSWPRHATKLANFIACHG